MITLWKWLISCRCCLLSVVSQDMHRKRSKEGAMSPGWSYCKCCFYTETTVLKRNWLTSSCSQLICTSQSNTRRNNTKAQIHFSWGTAAFICFLSQSFSITLHRLSFSYISLSLISLWSLCLFQPLSILFLSALPLSVFSLSVFSVLFSPFLFSQLSLVSKKKSVFVAARPNSFFF